MDQLKERPSSPEEPRKLDIGLLPATPALAANPNLTAEIFKTFQDSNAKAIVVVGYAAGTTPGAINPFITESVASGVPVFVLANNPGDDEGPQRIKYGVHQDAINAGATILRDVNINGVEEVTHAIQDSIDEGRTGQDLAQAIVDLFGTPEREYPDMR